MSVLNVVVTSEKMDLISVSNQFSSIPRLYTFTATHSFCNVRYILTIVKLT